MKHLHVVLIKKFRVLIVWWVKLLGWIFKSPVIYYIKTVQTRIFDRHKLTTNAAAISFFFLLSIIPMLFIVISLLGTFVQSPEEAELFIVNFVSNRVPESSRQFILDLVIQSNLISNVKGLLENKGWVGIISIASLLWTSSGAFAAVEDAMSTIFAVKARNYFVSRLVEMGMVLIIGSVFLLSNMVNAILQMLKDSRANLFNVDFSNLPYLWNIITEVMPVALTILMFYIIYKILPRTDIFNRAALLGAAVAGILLELSIHGFAYYVQNFARYSVFYGSIAGVVITIFSIYLSSIILLIGAEVTEIANTKMVNTRELQLTIKDFE
ncbi:YihY/virulence factor BrkB family protein [bacterium]|nr:YihY/virulence factor BrkB family protein [bacterium]